jgi:hypothetical protein
LQNDYGKKKDENEEMAQGDSENESITGSKRVHIVISFILHTTLSVHVHVITIDLLS